ncbi:MAG: endonuclease/exonuclease/phosphatase family metal-dependent hydrolase [Parasphingorhabdus sp.]|jgi:endonuclease/exonuclease/phosphatase family metal-dependent hydrolase
MSKILSLTLFLTLLSSLGNADGLRVGTWNAEWLYDHKPSKTGVTLERQMSAPNKAEYWQRIKTFAVAINELDVDFLALQEIEGRHVLKALAGALRAEFGQSYRYAFVEGTDTHTGQDVGLLVREGWTYKPSRFRFDRNAQQDGRNLSKHLRVDLSRDGQSYSVVIVHLITDKKKRLQQARTLHGWLSKLDNKGLLVMGDFNTKQKLDQTSQSGDMGTIRGLHTATSKDDLLDSHKKLSQRQTHVSGRELDRILLSPDLWKRLKKVEVRRKLAIKGSTDDSRQVDYSLPVNKQDLSDHFPLVAEFK